MVKVGQMAKSVFTHTDTPSRTILPHKLLEDLAYSELSFPLKTHQFLPQMLESRNRKAFCTNVAELLLCPYFLDGHTQQKALLPEPVRLDCVMFRRWSAFGGKLLC